MGGKLEDRARACPVKAFKAFIGKSRTQAILCADTGAEIVGWGGFDSSALEQQSKRKALARYIAAADPKTVLTLLAELETAQQRIADLEAKLATPVRLPQRCGPAASYVMGWNDCRAAMLGDG